MHFHHIITLTVKYSHLLLPVGLISNESLCEQISHQLKNVSQCCETNHERLWSLLYKKTDTLCGRSYCMYSETPLSVVGQLFFGVFLDAFVSFGGFFVVVFTVAPFSCCLFVSFFAPSFVFSNWTACTNGLMIISHSVALRNSFAVCFG